MYSNKKIGLKAGRPESLKIPEFQSLQAFQLASFLATLFSLVFEVKII
jgi:hypothetical protein